MNNNEESVLQQWVKGETLVVEGGGVGSEIQSYA